MAVKATLAALGLCLILAYASAPIWVFMVVGILLIVMVMLAIT